MSERWIRVLIVVVVVAFAALLLAYYAVWYHAVTGEWWNPIWESEMTGRIT